MTPNPRPRFRPNNDAPRSQSSFRIDPLLIMMVIQIILLIMVWVKLSNLSKSNSELTAKVEKNKPTEIRTPILEDLSSARETKETKMEIKSEVPALDEVISEPESAVAKPLRVQILNGCAVPRLAARLQEFVEDHGYVVKDVGNADRSNYDVSQIQNRSSSKADIQKLAQILGIDRANVKESVLKPAMDIDATIIIGKDYKRLAFAN